MLEEACLYVLLRETSVILDETSSLSSSCGFHLFGLFLLSYLSFVTQDETYALPVLQPNLLPFSVATSVYFLPFSLFIYLFCHFVFEKNKFIVVLVTCLAVFFFSLCGTIVFSVPYELFSTSRNGSPHFYLVLF